MQGDEQKSSESRLAEAIENLSHSNETLAQSNLHLAMSWNNFQKFIFKTSIQMMAAFFVVMMCQAILLAHLAKTSLESTGITWVNKITAQVNASEDRILKGQQVHQTVNVDRPRTIEDNAHDILKKQGKVN
jgi:hypothetical protein